jgi:hypothetical protein
MIGAFGVYGGYGTHDLRPAGTPASGHGYYDPAALIAQAQAGMAALVAQRRAEGAEAYRAGVKLKANPYGLAGTDDDATAWHDGWIAESQVAQYAGGGVYVPASAGSVSRPQPRAGGVPAGVPAYPESQVTSNSTAMWGPIDETVPMSPVEQTAMTELRRRNGQAPTQEWPMSPAAAAGLGIGGVLLVGGVLWLLFGGGGRR